MLLHRPAAGWSREEADQPAVQWSAQLRPFPGKRLVFSFVLPDCLARLTASSDHYGQWAFQMKRSEIRCVPDPGRSLKITTGPYLDLFSH